MQKSRDAFRTISEVAEWLGIPTHVLRFWESRFSQIKPVKRAGGRRYYRPSDMELIGGVKVLLHDEGMTIRGVQKLLREKGIKHVSGWSPPLVADDEAETGEVIEHDAALTRPAPAFTSRAARATHAATPAPEAPEATAPRETTDDAGMPEVDPDQPDMFPEPAATSATEPATAETAVEAGAESTDPEPDVETPPDSEPDRPVIPATPGVPPTDAADDDPSKIAEPGIAARLSLLPRSQLKVHRETLSTARKRLIALRDRAAAADA